MKCPKCGYNSFDYLDSCKKCGKDLVEFKQRFGIKSVLFSGATAVAVVGLAEDENLLAAEASELAAASALGAASVSGTAAIAAEPLADDSVADDFGFDFMGESSDEEELSFDDLFEEAPQEDDMEESLEAPKTTGNAATAEAKKSDFAFDIPDEDDNLAEDFGFDADDAVEDEVKPGKPKGSGEGPSDPFDLPESSPVVETPVTTILASSTTTAVAATGASTVVSGQWADDQLNLEDDALLEAVAEGNLPDSPDAEQIPGGVLTRATAPEVGDEQLTSEELPASLGGRFASLIYDAVILLVVGLGFVVAAELAMSRETGPLPTLDTLIDLSVPYFLVLFSLTFGYFTLFHFFAGQTPGKMLTGLRVETSAGEPLTFSQAFLRSVGGLLQFLPLGLGYVQLLRSGDGRGWNDRLAGTRVVMVTART